MTGPKAYAGIMVSSTFADLEPHRRELIDAIQKLGFRANVMEAYGAQADADVIDASMAMVRDSAALIVLISHRYGQIPSSPELNPHGLSISELEFNEAVRLGRPIIIFIMGDDHPVTRADVERDQEKRLKLDDFRNRAKQIREGSPVKRIYEVFNSLQEFAAAATVAISRLAQALSSPIEGPRNSDELATAADSIEAATPPDLRAIPRHFGSHEFVGREAELSSLDDWSSAADPHPLLLFEAIGGAGKSMLAWAWLTDRATNARSDWAGRFWFSFYESGATMTRFCQEALAYMTGQQLQAFREDKLRALMPRLIAELEARPWLIVLDGLERILVAYHPIDASQMRDEDIDTAEDEITNRDPRSAINPEDEDLLGRLTAAAPSKLLATSRLTPQALINRSGMPMPGVRREFLSGLRPRDAEMLFRKRGAFGDSNTIRAYLQSNCDCHPLVIGALAGLVNDYMPDRGNFDAWLVDPEAGRKLALGDLNLAQRRTHILDAALDALPEPGRKLLQIMSVLQRAADYATLKGLNPHLPTFPEKPEAAVEYAATVRLHETLAELEQRGLLQYEPSLRLYDLHPIVRGVLISRLRETEASEIGSRVFDYLSSYQPRSLGHDRREDSNFRVEKVVIKNIKCFEFLEVEFGSDERDALTVLIIGDNASGKSTILRCIALGMCPESDAAALIKDSKDEFIRQGARSAHIGISLRSGNFRGRIDTYIDRDLSDREVVRQIHSPTDFPWSRIFLSGYGTQRASTRPSSPKTYIAMDSVRSLFNDGMDLLNPEVILSRASIDQRLSIEGALKSLFMMEGIDGESQFRIARGESGIRVKGPWGEQPLSALSDGYRTTSLWVFDLIGRLYLADLELISRGVLLLDEVEQHLHPRWQRHIVQLIRNRFPEIQVIATTHTPLTVIGASDLADSDFISLFPVEGISPKFIKFLSTDLEGYRSDQVLTKMFGIFSTQSPSSIRSLERFSELLARKRTLREDEELENLGKELEDTWALADNELAVEIYAAVRQEIRTRFRNKRKNLHSNLVDHLLKSEISKILGAK